MPVYYCAPSDVRDNVAGTDHGAGTCAQLSDQQLIEAIRRASAKVSAYAGTVYEADAENPAGTVPELIFTIAVQISTYYGTLTYRKGKDLSQMDPVYLGYVDAMATLNAIAAGTIEPDPSAPGEPPPAPAVPRRVINTIPRTFTYADSGVAPNGLGGISAAGAPGSLLGDPGAWP